MKRRQHSPSGVLIFRVALSAGLISASAILLASSFKAQSDLSQSVESTGVTIVVPVPPVTPAAFRGDVRTLPPVPQAERERPEFTKTLPTQKQPLPWALTAEPEEPGPPVILAPMPAASPNFNGMSYTDTCTGGQCGHGHPPDPDGDVGLNYYVLQMNEAVAIYNKTGTLLASFTENSLFSGTGAPECDGNSFGDPQTVYDYRNDRWILSWFAFTLDVNGNPQAPIYQCFAASKTNNPITGGWWLYAIRMDNIGTIPSGAIDDYPKLGLWIDCLYMGANAFNTSGSFIGTEFWSFSYTDMEAGAPLTAAVAFIANSSDPFTAIPATMHGNTASAQPPPGTPGYFISESEATFAFEVRKFTAGTNCGAGGSLSAPTNVTQTGYNPPYAGSTTNYIPQPSTSTTLDSLGDRLMQKVQYRKVGSAESLWVAHSVCGTGTLFHNCTANTGIQWAQLDVTGGTIATVPVQQQKYVPDTTIYRWMPSIAVDNAGNVALGYSTSNASSPNFPSVAYSGRLVSDTVNTLPQTETQLIAGTGSQIFNCGGGPCSRWGDYTEMEVDPADDCTFWYVNMYYTSQTNGNSGNDTLRVGAFKFPSCTPVPPQTPVVAITKAADAPSVGAGSQIGFTVRLNNTGPVAASGLSVSDNLPAGTDVNWSIDQGNTSAGWSISGSPPNQSLTYSPTTLAGNTSTTAHVVSNTTNNSCGTYANTASFTTSNDGSSSASDSETVVCPVQLTAVVSRLTHTGIGDFDVNMPLPSALPSPQPRGVECRSSTSLGAGNYTIVFSFSNALTSVGGANASEAGCGTIAVSSRSISGSDYVVNLTGVCNAQYANVSLLNVSDSVGNHSDTVVSPDIGFLVGDVNASGRVDAADVSLVRQQTLQPIGSSNFRADVNASGRIDAADVSVARQDTLTSLPSTP